MIKTGILSRRSMLAATGAAVGCMLAGVVKASTQTLRILMPETHGHTFRLLYLGLEKGWFAAEGLDIEFLPVPGGAVNLVPQLAQGAGDIAFAGGYTVIQARSRGVDVIGIHSASSESLWSLIAHRDAGIAGPEDLRGKTIGVVAFSSQTHFMVLGLLQAAGLTEADVNIQPIGMGGPAALAQRQIDAYVWFRSQGIGLRLRGADVDILPIDSMIPIPQDLLLVTSRTASERAEQIRAFLRVYKAARDYDLDPANHAEVDSYQTKFAPETTSDAQFLEALRVEDRLRFERDEQRGWRYGSIDSSRIAEAQAFLLSSGIIERETPVENMFTNDLLP